MAGCCGQAPKYDYGKCKCCELVDGDTSLKIVSYCELCRVYLCEPCRSNPMKRIKAFGKQFFE